LQVKGLAGLKKSPLVPAGHAAGLELADGPGLPRPAERLHKGMDVTEIQHAIEALPKDRQALLAGWLYERDQAQWEAEIERDFSPAVLATHRWRRWIPTPAPASSASLRKAGNSGHSPSLK